MKLVACFPRTHKDSDSVATAMANAMRLFEPHHCRTFPAGEDGSLACVETGDRFSRVKLVRESDSGNVLLISGVPLDLHGSLDECLQRVVKSDTQRAVKELTGLDGAFAALFWDASAKKLVVITDALGLQPLYLARPGGGLLLASELKAFPASGLVDVAMDPAGWGAFVSLQFNIGERTQLAGVSRIEAANVLVYCARTGKLESKQYWSRPEPVPDMKLEEVDTGELLDLVRCEIRGYAAHSPVGTLLLSGGFDSRLLASLLHEEGIDCAALILQGNDGLSRVDRQSAVRIADTLLGGDYELIRPSSRFFDSPGFLRYLVMSEVAVPCMKLFITKISQYIRPEMKAVWEGVGPGFGFAPAYPYPGAFDEYLKNRCRPTTSLHWNAARYVFSPAMAGRMETEFTELLKTEIGHYANDEFGVARFQMDTQMRRRLGLNPTKVYANHVLPFTPCVSKEFWNVAARIPHTVTASQQLYLKLFRDHFPQAHRVPFCSGGTLYGSRRFTPGLWSVRMASSLEKQISYYWSRTPRLPVAGAAFKSLGAGQDRRIGRHNLMDRVIQRIDPDQEDLDATGVAAVKAARPPYDWNVRLGRSLLFYWQTWRWDMEGQLSTWNADSFLHQEEASHGQ
jgi:hypothetical protein